MILLHVFRNEGGKRLMAKGEELMTEGEELMAEGE